MTTSESPDHVLRSQAHRIMETLKRCALGVPANNMEAQLAQKFSANQIVAVAIAMDDKIIELPISRQDAISMSREALTVHILDLMRNKRGTEH